MFDLPAREIYIFSEQKLNLAQFLEACRRDNDTVSLITALSAGYRLIPVPPDEAKKFIEMIAKRKEKRSGVIVIYGYDSPNS